jgi:quercetin dioxygenase-like cupin family protein
MEWTKYMLAGGICVITMVAQAQRIENVLQLLPEDQFENIKVKGLDNSDDASSFIIWVKDHVREHYHKEHTEVVYVIEGSGMMTLGNDSYSIEKGDYIFIPRGTPHSVRVNEENTLKVISIQTPHFDGTDRHFTNRD